MIWLRGERQFLPLIALFATIAIIIFSEMAFQAALDGLRVWWEIVFPALLPFFIMAQILMGLGVVHFFGTLLEPLMRPLFKIPGEGAFAFSMGLAAGYPLGAKISGDLRREGLCNQIEGERLVSFCNTADPLFMIGAVAVGFYSNAALGITLSIAHYLSCILVGLSLRFYGVREERGHQEVKSQETLRGSLLRRALEKQIVAYRQDGRSFGNLLGDAVRDSMNDLLLIGGFIILFSVFTSIMAAIFMNLLHPIFTLFLKESLVMPLFSGVFEITIGSHALSLTPLSIQEKMIWTSLLIAWSGLSVHAQVATMVKGTDIRLKIYLLARILHALLAALITFILMMGPIDLASIPFISIPVFSHPTLQSTSYLGFLWMTLRGIGGILFYLTIISLSIYLFKKIFRYHLS